MHRTEAIHKAHPWMSFEDTLRVVIYQHQGAQWIKGLTDTKLEDSMNEYTRKITRANRKQLEPFVRHLKERYMAKLDEDVRQADFKERWHEGQKLLEGRTTTVKARSS